jgi:hypothetical protein
MSIYQLNFNQKAVELLPPDKRRTKFVKWVQSLLSQNTWLHTKIFVDYKTGATYPNYSAFTTYNTGNRVIYGQSVYESIADGNTALPTDVTKWRVYQPFFIGTDERIMYNHIKLVLEYALNRRFQTVFRQPPLISDIYITTNIRTTNPFIVGIDESESSVVFYDTSSEFIVNSYAFGAAFFNYTVNVPLAVYNGVSADPAAREKIFRIFIDQYNTIGLNYNIITY